MERLRASVSLREATAAIPDLDNDALIIRLLFTVNHLSRWLTPIHGQTILNRSPRRDQPSVKELLLRLRDEELRSFPKLHAIATRTTPDLDKLPPVLRSPADDDRDRRASTVELLAIPGDEWLVPLCSEGDIEGISTT